MSHSPEEQRKIRKEFCENLLKIEVPVTVTLAKKPMPIEQITSLVPGVMIQFDMTCDTPLMVEIDNTPIADGEVVKVGDKFGLRIGNILGRGEQFKPLITNSTDEG